MALRKVIKLQKHRGHRLETAPSSLLGPVTLAELKRHLRITGSDEDEYLSDLLEETTKEVEDLTGLAFLTQSWKLTLDQWPSEAEDWWDGVREGPRSMLYGEASHDVLVELPRYPLSSVTSVTVYDTDGTSTAITVNDIFDVDIESFRGRLVLKYGQTWPVALRPTNAIEIVYAAGYGAAADVPAPLKRAIKSMASYMYEHRGDCSTEDAYSKSGAMSILRRYALVEI